MHADHIMGLITFLRNVLYPPMTPAKLSNHPPSVEIYGPAGLRLFIRSNLKLTFTKTSERYVVHELLTQSDEITPCSPPNILHSSECAGRDVACDDSGFWIEFASKKGRFGNVVVDAGPILHRDPCIGYIIRESVQPYRKLVILGDTYDPSAIAPLAMSPPPSLLVHEATDAFIPRSVDPKSNRSRETVQQKVLAHGHSTSVMAGEFAKQIGAQMLVLNHIGTRFSAPYIPPRKNDIRVAIIKEIERQATEAWGMGRAQAAVDYKRIIVPPSNQSAASMEPSLQTDAREANEINSQMGHATADQKGVIDDQRRRKKRKMSHDVPVISTENN
ncbi:beta-lactamase-like protein [Hygrophoropsis aurantiaca]|uniref:Beta-lactamase-like protein n=1 Tax=Hygrophoropsis aurantiaca TaxID=72124 RepID=A0ACB8AR23_9AGAM|nr:beta-lactamase-like protein [Hygrophoropsis aurantiaca]